MANPTEEIAQLEHELAALRSQYALVGRNGRVMKLSCQLMLAPLAVLFGVISCGPMW